jgi:hypothetical protein
MLADLAACTSGTAGFITLVSASSAPAAAAQMHTDEATAACVCAHAMQACIALIESDACKLALKNLDQELVPPAGYNAAMHMPAAAAAAVSGSPAGAAAGVDVGPSAADVDDDGVRLPSATVEQLQRLLVEVRENTAGHD